MTQLPQPTWRWWQQRETEQVQSSHIDGEIVGALIPDLAVLHSEDASRAAVGREKHRCSLDPLGGGFRSRRASMPAGALLLSAVIAIQLDRMNARVFGDGWIGAQACMWVNKFHEESTVTALSPSSPIAQGSIARHPETMQSAYVRIAEGGWRDVAPAAQLQRRRP
ncbi:polyketide synthase [Mycobacterium tuberculosis variant bovis]|uniref:polyketide synthase n=1 Tax=Mycobacterium tuberculosis TaxID=1773 RepID=UPI00235A288B|nr:polyketide synthase [Mycobacterium tuberculosis]WCR90976.1 polyketide synthase [Mycobacterium tuberculosis variant bovis]